MTRTHHDRIHDSLEREINDEGPEEHKTPRVNYTMECVRIEARGRAVAYPASLLVLAKKLEIEVSTLICELNELKKQKGIK